MVLENGYHAVDNRAIPSPMSIGVDNELVDHAAKIGIKLKSSNLPIHPHMVANRYLQYMPPRTAPPSYGRRSAQPLKGGNNIPTPAFIQNVVVPLVPGQPEDMMFRGQSVSPTPAGGRRPQTTLSTYKRTPSGRISARSGRASLGSYVDSRYTSTPNERAMLEHPSMVDPTAQRKWNKSGQALRFESEQIKKQKCKTLKKVAEIQPHRVDRMYYMNGSSVSMAPRYHVDNDELDRLKNLSRARKEAKHYGRGLSNMSDLTDRYNPEKELEHYLGLSPTPVPLTARVPRQPPPSSLSQNKESEPAFITDGERDERAEDDKEDSVSLPSEGGKSPRETDKEGAEENTAANDIEQKTKELAISGEQHEESPNDNDANPKAEESKENGESLNDGESPDGQTDDIENQTQNEEV